MSPPSTLAAEAEKTQAQLQDANQHIASNINAIIEICEKLLQNDALDEVTSAAIYDIINLCSFQDIVGQRLNIIATFLNQISGKTTASRSTEDARNQQAQGLLDGPQLSGEGMSQDDIDKLF